MDKYKVRISGYFEYECDVDAQNINAAVDKAELEHWDNETDMSKVLFETENIEVVDKDGISYEI